MHANDVFGIRVQLETSNTACRHHSNSYCTWAYLLGSKDMTVQQDNSFLLNLLAQFFPGNLLHHWKNTKQTSITIVKISACTCILHIMNVVCTIGYQ